MTKELKDEAKSYCGLKLGGDEVLHEEKRAFNNHCTVKSFRSSSPIKIFFVLRAGLLCHLAESCV